MQGLGGCVRHSTTQTPMSSSVGQLTACLTHATYLGHLLATIIVAGHCHQSKQNNHLSYEWINDNTGALKWAENHKYDSEASQYACLTVTQLHQSEKIFVRATTHKAGIDMGEIDTMSRIHDNENPLDTAVQLRCNNRLPNTSTISPSRNYKYCSNS